MIPKLSFSLFYQSLKPRLVKPGVRALCMLISANKFSTSSYENARLTDKIHGISLRADVALTKAAFC